MPLLSCLLRFTSLSFRSLDKLISVRTKTHYTHCRSVTCMDSGDGTSSACTLVLCGKSSAEKEIALSLKKNSAVKLPDDTPVSILLESEIAKLDKEPFNVELFFNCLSTRIFGRFLIWSPRLTSTHDVVSL